MNTGVTFNLDQKNETKKASMEKIMRLAFEQVIMSDRHISNGQIY